MVPPLPCSEHSQGQEGGLWCRKQATSDHHAPHTRMRRPTAWGPLLLLRPQPVLPLTAPTPARQSLGERGWGGCSLSPLSGLGTHPTLELCGCVYNGKPGEQRSWGARPCTQEGDLRGGSPWAAQCPGSRDPSTCPRSPPRVPRPWAHRSLSFLSTGHRGCAGRGSTVPWRFLPSVNYLRNPLCHFITKKPVCDFPGDNTAFS